MSRLGWFASFTTWSAQDMFREAAQLLKQFIMFRTRVSTPPHVDIVLFTSMEKKKGGTVYSVYSLTKVKPGGVGRRHRGHKGGVRGIICPGWQPVAHWRCLLLVPSWSSSVLLHIITMVNLWVLPVSCPTRSFLISFALPTWDFCLFSPPFFPLLGSRGVRTELPLFIVICWDNEQMTCHLEHLEPGVKLRL